MSLPIWRRHANAFPRYEASLGSVLHGTPAALPPSSPNHDAAPLPLLALLATDHAFAAAQEHLKALVMGSCRDASAILREEDGEVDENVLLQRLVLPPTFGQEALLSVFQTNSSSLCTPHSTRKGMGMGTAAPPPPPPLAMHLQTFHALASSMSAFAHALYVACHEGSDPLANDATVCAARGVPPSSFTHSPSSAAQRVTDELSSVCFAGPQPLPSASVHQSPLMLYAMRVLWLCLKLSLVTEELVQLEGGDGDDEPSSCAIARLVQTVLFTRHDPSSSSPPSSLPAAAAEVRFTALMPHTTLHPSSLLDEVFLSLYNAAATFQRGARKTLEAASDVSVFHFVLTRLFAMKEAANRIDSFAQKGNHNPQEGSLLDVKYLIPSREGGVPVAAPTTKSSRAKGVVMSGGKVNSGVGDGKEHFILSTSTATASTARGVGAGAKRGRDDTAASDSSPFSSHGVPRKKLPSTASCLSVPTGDPALSFVRSSSGGASRYVAFEESGGAVVLDAILSLDVDGTLSDTISTNNNSVPIIAAVRAACENFASAAALFEGAAMLETTLKAVPFFNSPTLPSPPQGLHQEEKGGREAPRRSNKDHALLTPSSLPSPSIRYDFARCALVASAGEAVARYDLLAYTTAIAESRDVLKANSCGVRGGGAGAERNAMLSNKSVIIAHREEVLAQHCIAAASSLGAKLGAYYSHHNSSASSSSHTPSPSLPISPWLPHDDIALVSTPIVLLAMGLCHTAVFHYHKDPSSAVPLALVPHILPPIMMADTLLTSLQAAKGKRGRQASAAQQQEGATATRQRGKKSGREVDDHTTREGHDGESDDDDDDGVECIGEWLIAKDAMCAEDDGTADADEANPFEMPSLLHYSGGPNALKEGSHGRLFSPQWVAMLLKDVRRLRTVLERENSMVFHNTVPQRVLQAVEAVRGAMDERRPAATTTSTKRTDNADGGAAKKGGKGFFAAVASVVFGGKSKTNAASAAAEAPPPPPLLPLVSRLLLLPVVCLRELVPASIVPFHYLGGGSSNTSTSVLSFNSAQSIAAQFNAMCDVIGGGGARYSSHSSSSLQLLDRLAHAAHISTAPFYPSSSSSSSSSATVSFASAPPSAIASALYTTYRSLLLRQQEQYARTLGRLEEEATVMRRAELRAKQDVRFQKALAAAKARVEQEKAALAQQQQHQQRINAENVQQQRLEKERIAKKAAEAQQKAYASASNASSSLRKEEKAAAVLSEEERLRREVAARLAEAEQQRRAAAAEKERVQQQAKEAQRAAKIAEEEEEKARLREAQEEQQRIAAVAAAAAASTASEKKPSPSTPAAQAPTLPPSSPPATNSKANVSSRFARKIKQLEENSAQKK